MLKYSGYPGIIGCGLSVMLKSAVGSTAGPGRCETCQRRGCIVPIGATGVGTPQNHH